ncbi:MAG: hypothetical protein GYA55_12050 [SAR324 cluster bacterium]|uniref:Glycosyltransferase RgtA/B/C/D-like domain-containing protein n=1 Tax=SAR324 cluster bacterium TaxID=2024889 RepID=A0A7X9FTL1_9DELT|nr:hypothetical protein [SAR324 cluster bacterium]
MLITTDGEDYLKYANLIGSHSFEEINPYNKVILRSPLYPWLIAFATSLGWEELEAVRALHISVAFLSLVAIALLLRPVMHPLITIPCAALPLIQGRVFYFSVLTE